MSKKFNETKIGAFLASKAPKVLSALGDVLPNQGTLGVVKNLKGGKRNTDPNEYLIAFDMSKKGYRNIYYNTIERITVNKQTFFVRVVDTKHYRFALIDSTNKKDMENI